MEKDNLKVLVCGGRFYNDELRVLRELGLINQEHGIKCIIQGGATGADNFAHNWAKVRGIPSITYGANWILYKKAAGPIRNKFMLEDSKPDLVIAFPGSNGTANMVSLAKKANTPVIEIGQ